MQRVDRRQVASIAKGWAARFDRLMSFAVILLASVLIYQGGNEAHVLSGVGLNLNWAESRPEAKAIFGFGLLTLVLVLITLRRVNSLRRQMLDHRP